jgi:hypothetical protein
MGSQEWAGSRSGRHHLEVYGLGVCPRSAFSRLHPRKASINSSEGRSLPSLSSILHGTQTRGPGRSGVGSGFHTFIVKLGNNYTGLSLTAQQTNRKRTEPERVGMVPAHARGRGGGGQRKRKTERDRNHYKSTGLCSQRQGRGWSGGGAGPFPGGARRWEVARTKRNTTPRWALDAPKTPLPTTPPTHERDTAPLPTQITRGDTVSPFPWADIPAREPHG